MGIFETWITIIKKIKEWNEILKVWVLKLSSEMGETQLSALREKLREKSCLRPPIARRVVQTDGGRSNFSCLGCIFQSFREIKETLGCCKIQFLIVFLFFFIFTFLKKSKCKSQIRTSQFTLGGDWSVPVIGAIKQQLDIKLNKPLLAALIERQTVIRYGGRQCTSVPQLEFAHFSTRSNTFNYCMP